MKRPPFTFWSSREIRLTNAFSPAGSTPMSRIIEANSGKGRCPVSQQVNEPAICETRRSGAFGHVADARPTEHSFQHQLGALQRHRPLNIKAHFLAMAFEFPAIDRSARQAQADAVMRQQVLWRLRSRRVSRYRKGRP